MCTFVVAFEGWPHGVMVAQENLALLDRVRFLMRLQRVYFRFCFVLVSLICNTALRVNAVFFIFAGKGITIWIG